MTLPRYLILISAILWTIACNETADKASITIKNEAYCNCNDLIYDELYNHFYIDERNKPYTGICYERYESKKIKLTKEFKEGKLHGNMIRFKEDSTKISFVVFKKNFIHGKAIFYDSMGNDSIVQTYKRGALVTH
jgi:antitoxin component YwqK of YwqJK toxin-antitoxin module